MCSPRVAGFLPVVFWKTETERSSARNQIERDRFSLPSNRCAFTSSPMAGRVAKAVPHLLTLADLSPSQINGLVSHAHYLKHISIPWLSPQQGGKPLKLQMPPQSLLSKSIALLFSKRSTRTRLSAETASTLLGGKALFLGKDDIQLGVNESARDTARVIGGMCQGIFARVGDHAEIEVSTTGLIFIPRSNTEWVTPGACTIFSRPRPECVIFVMAPDPGSGRLVDPPRARFPILWSRKKYPRPQFRTIAPATVETIDGRLCWRFCKRPARYACNISSAWTQTPHCFP